MNDKDKTTVPIPKIVIETDIENRLYNSQCVHRVHYLCGAKDKVMTIPFDPFKDNSEEIFIENSIKMLQILYSEIVVPKVNK